MSLLRTDQQVAINSLHQAMATSVGHYLDAAEFLQEDEIVKFMQNSAKQRESYCERIINVLNKLGDLPMSPDVEKENLAQLMFQMGAKASNDEVMTILQQRLDAEQELYEQLSQTQALQLEEYIQELLEEIQRHVKQQIEKIRIRMSS